MISGQEAEIAKCVRRCGSNFDPIDDHAQLGEGHQPPAFCRKGLALIRAHDHGLSRGHRIVAAQGCHFAVVVLCMACGGAGDGLGCEVNDSEIGRTGGEGSARMADHHHSLDLDAIGDTCRKAAIRVCREGEERVVSRQDHVPRSRCEVDGVNLEESALSGPTDQADCACLHMDHSLPQGDSRRSSWSDDQCVGLGESALKCGMDPGPRMDRESHDETPHCKVQNFPVSSFHLEPPFNLVKMSDHDGF